MADCSKERIDLILETARRFTRETLSEISQTGLDLIGTRTIFIGGGSMLLRRHIEGSGMAARPFLVDDIRANAKGYETLYRNSGPRRTGNGA